MYRWWWKMDVQWIQTRVLDDAAIWLWCLEYPLPIPWILPYCYSYPKKRWCKMGWCIISLPVYQVMLLLRYIHCHLLIPMSHPCIYPKKSHVDVMVRDVDMHNNSIRMYWMVQPFVYPLSISLVHPLALANEGYVNMMTMDVSKCCRHVCILNATVCTRWCCHLYIHCQSIDPFSRSCQRMIYESDDDRYLQALVRWLDKSNSNPYTWTWWWHCFVYPTPKPFDPSLSLSQ